MSVNDDLVPILKKLRLSGVLQSLELRIKEAMDDNLAQTEFLYRLLCDEVERRESKQLHVRLRRAAFNRCAPPVPIRATIAGCSTSQGRTSC